MIGAVQQMKRGSLAKTPRGLAHEVQLREGVARALQKQHRDANVEKVLRALVRWTVRGMQREAEEDKPAYAGQG